MIVMIQTHPLSAPRIFTDLSSKDLDGDGTDDQIDYSTLDMTWQLIDV